MSVSQSLVIAAILSLAGVPAMAQHVIYEPGYCAFYYPNANCQNEGPGNPYIGSYQRSLAAGGIAGSQTTAVAPPRARSHRTPKRPQ